MATVRLLQQEFHSPWREGEIVTLKVVGVEGDGMFVCDTIETYPPDLKEQHAAALVARDASHQAVVDDLKLRLGAAQGTNA